ncbi:hypothetical protein BLNAU_18300 [Blattamonas nauphoetae]|uniref:VWFA domain-containing protein n=1 Tax=Blattamonas nauphoetae TaxID=2049346 RepID=A0ABQ9X511_9EUKA|nr:hypothetical protein BLNAU_18300 [Blattamonas nauphoetae]
MSVGMHQTPADFKRVILKSVMRCIDFDHHPEKYSINDVQQIHRELDNVIPFGSKEELIQLAHEKIARFVVREDEHHGHTQHLFSPFIVNVLKRAIKTDLTDDIQSLMLLHSDIDGNVPIGSISSLRIQALRKCITLLKEDIHCLPNVTGFEKYVRLSLDTEPVVRIADGSGELNGLVSIQAPTLDDSAPEDHICVCFVVSVAHAMEEEGKLDEILEGIRETVDQLDTSDYIALVTFSRAASVLLPLTRVGTIRSTDTGDETTFHDYNDSANDSVDFELSVTNGGSEEDYMEEEKPSKPSVDFERILRDIRVGTTSNLCEGLESGIKEINNHLHDGLIPPTYRRVVVLIGNGSVNEGIRDTNMIGAVVKRYRQSDQTHLITPNTQQNLSPRSSSFQPPSNDPYSMSVPFVISTVGVGMQTAEEENVLRTVALRGGGEFNWAASTEDEEIRDVILNSVMSWKVRTTRHFRVSLVGTDALEKILPTPNISCQSEPAPIVGTHTRIIRMETSQLVDLINFNNEEVFFGSTFTSESTAEQVRAFHEEMRHNPNKRKEMVKIRTLDTADLVSGEERQLLINFKLWTTSSPTSDGTGFVSAMDRQKLNEVKEVGAILVTYRYFNSLDTDAVFIPIKTRVVVESGRRDLRDPLRSSLLTTAAQRATQDAIGLNQKIMELEGNESMERLRAFMMFSNANEKLKEAALEAEKGNVRKAKEMAQEAQQTVNAFAAPRLLSKERVLRRLIEVSSELGERLDVRDSRNWDDATATDMFPRVLLALTRMSPEDQLEVQKYRSYTLAMNADSRISHFIAIVDAFLGREGSGEVRTEDLALAARQISYFQLCTSVGVGSHSATSMTERGNSLQKLVRAVWKEGGVAKGSSGVGGGKREVLVDNGSESQSASDVSSSYSGGVEEKGGVWKGSRRERKAAEGFVGSESDSERKERRRWRGFGFGGRGRESDEGSEGRSGSEREMSTRLLKKGKLGGVGSDGGREVGFTGREDERGGRGEEERRKEGGKKGRSNRTPK